MTPPPSDPIRPIGPLDGGTYVNRIERTTGRRRRSDDPAQHERHEPHEDEPERVRDPRAYDDHGRAPGDDDEPEHPHVDTTV